MLLFCFLQDSFYQFLSEDTNSLSAQKIITILTKYIHFDSVIDIGCGVGQILRVCAENGVNIIRGIDGAWVKPEMLLIPSECFTSFDISQPNLKDIIPEQHFDLTISSEVAEHIEQQDSGTYMNDLTSFSEVILFSAAIPGQGGTHHVNEQWPSYWIDKFAERGFIPIDCIRQFLWSNEKVSLWYRQNLLLFVKKDALNKYPYLEKKAGKPVFDVVHFDMWKNHINRMKHHQQSFSMNCKRIFLGVVDLFPSFFGAMMRRLRRLHDKI